MAQLLSILGGWAFRHSWRVIISWILVIATTTGLMVHFVQPMNNSFTIPGTQAQTAIDKLTKTLPEVSGGVGRIVFVAPDGESITTYKDTIEKSLSAAAKVQDVRMIVSPWQTGTISQDGSTAIAQVPLTIKSGEAEARLSDDINHALQPLRNAGLQIELGGDIINLIPSDVAGIGELTGVILAAIVLLITLGSLAAAGMPLVVGLLGTGIGVTSIFALSTASDNILTVTPILALMLGIAVGIDYALFIINRYRKYLMQNKAPEQAAKLAMATAGNSVVFAALTVTIALTALSVIGIPILTVMGLSAAATILVVAFVAVTLIPALLGLTKLRVLSRKQRQLLARHKPEETPAEFHRKSVMYKWGVLIAKHPVIAIVLSVVVLCTIALPARDIALGFPSDASAGPQTTQRKASDIIDHAFGYGYNGPLVVVTQLNTPLPPEQLQQSMGAIAGRLSKLDTVQTVVPVGVGRDGRTIALQVIPKTGPADQATKNLVATIRHQGSILAGNHSSPLEVTGTTAMMIDVDKALADALPHYLLVVVGLSIILLMVVFRSILIPIKATVGFLLTIVATLGALVALFQWGWFGIFEPSPIISFLPIIVVGILFGLAMDYEFFLLSGIYEAHIHEKKGARLAVVEGFGHSARVVVAAALIMVFVFSGFVFSHNPMIQMVGFALAFGVFVDAFIVRMTIVPAVMTLLGKAAWWMPRWLERILPKVSVDGDEKV